METINQPKNFMELQPKEFKSLYYMYLDLLAAGKSPQEILHALSEKMEVAYGFPTSISSKVSKLIYNHFSSPTFATEFIDVFDVKKQPILFGQESEKKDTPPQKLFLSTIDMERYDKLTSEDPQISLPIKRLLLALMSVYRRNFHHSGWVKYDRKLVFYLAGLQDMPPKEAELLTQYLHAEYGFNMLVIGSNSPTPCFKIDWLFDQPQPGSHVNAFVEYGPFSPETIASITCGTAVPRVIN